MLQQCRQTGAVWKSYLVQQGAAELMIVGTATNVFLPSQDLQV